MVEFKYRLHECDTRAHDFKFPNEELENKAHRRYMLQVIWKNPVWTSKNPDGEPKWHCMFIPFTLFYSREREPNREMAVSFLKEHLREVLKIYDGLTFPDDPGEVQAPELEKYIRFMDPHREAISIQQLHLFYAYRYLLYSSAKLADQLTYQYEVYWSAEELSTPEEAELNGGYEIVNPFCIDSRKSNRLISPVDLNTWACDEPAQYDWFD